LQTNIAQFNKIPLHFILVVIVTRSVELLIREKVVGAGADCRVCLPDCTGDPEKPAYFAETLMHDETKTPARWVAAVEGRLATIDAKGYYSTHTFRHSCDSSVLDRRNFAAPLQTTQLNDAEGMLVTWSRAISQDELVTVTAKGVCFSFVL